MIGKTINRAFKFAMISFLCWAEIPPCMGETIPAGSKVLFVGAAAPDYMNCFMGIYGGDASVNSLNVTADSFDTAANYIYGNVLDAFYGELYETPKTALMLKLDEGFDYIVFIPSATYAKDSPELTMETTRTLKSYTHDAGTEVIAVMPWDGADAANTGPYEDHLYRISDALNVDCLPAGLSWKAVVQDGSIAAGNCAPKAPNEAAEYTLAATLYAQFFEQTPAASSYSHGSLSASQQTAIMNHSYAAWDAAQTNTHYTGEYVSTFCAPWAVPHDLGNRTWTSMGTSTEDRTRIKLRELIERAGYTYRGTHMNGYSYSSYYFPDNLLDSSAQDAVINGDFDFAFGRRERSTYPSAMDTLHTYDPDSGGDTKFIAFEKHYQNEPDYTYSMTAYQSVWEAQAAASDPDVLAIPNFIGFGRILIERPELEIIPKNDVHLTDLGSYLQAGMIYTIVTGGENPVSNDPLWTPDERYILNVAYKTVMELGGLKHVGTPPIAYNGLVETTQGTPVPFALKGIDLDMLPLSASIVSGPDHGALNGSGLNYTYTPTNGFVGDDSFTFLLNNGTTNSYEATVSILVAYGIVDIIGNTTGEPGGEFADYSALSNGSLWDDSTDDDGAVQLSISRTGFNDDVSISKWRQETYLGSGAEIVYAKGSPTATNAADAIANNAFIALKLDSTGFDAEEFSLESLSVLQWRNGSASPDSYQLAYDADGDGFGTNDLIGSAVNNTGSGPGSSFEVSASFFTPGATRHEVRLYYWGGADFSTGHSHIYDVRAYYTPPVEPPTYQTIDMLGNTTGTPGGEFADYSDLPPGSDNRLIQNWPDSVVNDGVISLSAGVTGLVSDVSVAGFNLASYLGAGSEIEFSKNVNSGIDTPEEAIAANAFIAFKLDSTGFGSDEFTWDSIAVSLWRNGAASPTAYQLAYDADGNGFGANDLIGSAVVNNLAGADNAFVLSSALTNDAATRHEVRMYYWGGTVVSGNSHLFGVEATYTVNPAGGYGSWATQFGGTNTIGSATDDYDNDGISNLGEYALNGNPTNELDRGQTAFGSDGSTFTYVHAKVVDDTNLIYRLLDTTNLISGIWNTNTYVLQTLGPAVDNYEMVTNHYSTPDGSMYFKLEVEQP